MRFYEHNFPSRRSVVMSRRAMVASSQPLAVEAAINTLRSGGNAIDAAVTATFVLSVVEPMSTGLGGDGFALIYLSKKERLVGINASGRSPRASTVDALIERGINQMPLEGPMSITVPGFLDGLAQCLARHGTVSLRDALQPAIFYAENGFPVTEITAQLWARKSDKLRGNSESARIYLPEGKAPEPGQLFRNPELAQTFRSIAAGGIDVFYRGDIGEKIVTAVRDLGGLISRADLTEHISDWVEPIKASYRGYEVIEMPPNNQGLAALIALNIVEGYRLFEMTHNSSRYLHCLIEAMKLALSDAQNNVGDPDVSTQIDSLLSKDHAEELRAQIDTHKSGNVGGENSEDISGDTVYVAVVDEQRNVVSMISSLFKAFGSGVTVPGTGLLLQNRGSGFRFESDHPNTLAPGKRPYHTIMPAMIMRDNQPWACFGLVGGLMQPQGHLQVVCNLIDFEMNPQAALDAPRFRVLEGGMLALEDGLSENVCGQLASLGHNVASDSTEEGFGGGQILVMSGGMLYGGSDKRKDGCAIGY
ncbi:gamma-glutamyltransferase [soil metagenome]